MRVEEEAREGDRIETSLDYHARDDSPTREIIPTEPFLIRILKFGSGDYADTQQAPSFKVWIKIKLNKTSVHRFSPIFKFSMRS